MELCRLIDMAETEEVKNFLATIAVIVLKENIEIGPE